MAERRHPQVANVDEVEGRTMTEGTKFGATRKLLGHATGAKGIGCSWHEVQPGRSAYPRHYHCVAEESLFVLEGEGTLKIGNSTVEVRKNDYLTFPTGPDHAHILTNSGKNPLRYLAFSVLGNADIVGYPDSKKIGVGAAASYEAAMKGQFWIRTLLKEGPSAGYYEGEDVG
jgi:uncharacterized cupin superfamily protein